MYKILLTAFLVIAASINAQNNSTFSNKITDSKELKDLFSAVQSESADNTSTPDFLDFKSKAQSGLDNMNPGSIIRNLRCEKITDWSESVSEKFHSYFTEKYKNDNMKNQDLTDDIISEFRNKQIKLCILNWEIFNNGIVTPVRSIAVLDNNWKVLFDSELINFILKSESVEIPESDNNSPDQTNTIKYQDSQTKSRLLNLSGPFGSVQLYYEARVTAIVPPYITASTNDADYNYFTNHIICEPRNPTGIPPNATPFLYFGTGGEYAILYQNATPFKSTISFSGGTGDRFNTGLYNVAGSNGLSWTFSYDFSVDFPGGGIGITPVSNISALSLSANNNSSINLLNYVYNSNVVTGDVRAVFFDGGSLNADNFKILTASGAGETGDINVSSKLQVGYMAPNISETPVPNFFPETATAFNFPVHYLRGDHVLQPDYQLTSTNYNIQVGQIDTLKAKITNNSHAVSLKGGSITLNIASLNDHMTLLSQGTFSVDSIDTAGAKVFNFIVQGSSNGIVTPQANISSLGWGFPVPPDVLINNIVSINSNIDVDPLLKTLTLTMPVQGFYNSGSNTMNSDTARVYLRNSTSPFAIVDTSKAFLNSSGTGTFLFSHANNFTQYYIQTKHRNSIETWSNTPQNFVNSALTYDFSTANTQAFGDNLIQVDASPVRFAIYSADINQDGSVDLNDMTNVYNDANNFVIGYVVTDVTGDNVVDLSDMSVTYNNSKNFVGVIKP